MGVLSCYRWWYEFFRHGRFLSWWNSFIPGARLEFEWLKKEPLWCADGPSTGSNTLRDTIKYSESKFSASKSGNEMLCTMAVKHEWSRDLCEIKLQSFERAKLHPTLFSNRWLLETIWTFPIDFQIRSFQKKKKTAFFPKGREFVFISCQTSVKILQNYILNFMEKIFVFHFHSW